MSRNVLEPNEITEKISSFAKTATPKKRAACIVTYSDFGANTRGRKQAAALLEAGYSVDIIIPRSHSDSRNWGLPDELNLHFVPLYKQRSRRQLMYAVRYFLFFVLAFATVTRLYFKQHYQFIQVATLPEFLVFTALIPRLLGAKVILDVCDLSSELYESKFRRSASDPVARLVRAVEKLSLVFANTLLTVHEPYRQKLLERGIADKKITVLLNVADETVFKQAQVTSEAAKLDHSIRLVYHGTIARRNGVDIIVQALAHIKEIAPDLKLVLDVYGDGDAYPELVKLIEELQVNELVQLHRGFVSIAQLPAILAGADAGIVANRNDGFMEYTLPTKLLEYVALGIFGIVARTITIEAYFDATQVAFFEPENHQELAQRIIELTQDPAMAKVKAERAYSFYAKHNWRETKQHYQKLVTSL